MRRVLLLWVALLALPAAAAPLPETDATFHARILALYDFHPHALEEQQVAAKSAALDAFWAEAKANPAEVLPRLRAELAAPANPAFFYYDGAKLLLSLSQQRADMALALDAAARADLNDIQHSDYLTTVHWLASQGLDTRAAALRLLAYPDFQAFIPQHSLTLGQDYSLIYLLFPLQGIAFENDLVERLRTERDPTAQKSLLLALWYTATPAGTAALLAFSQDPATRPALAATARELLARRPGRAAPRASAAALRDRRARLMQRPISDESLMEFDTLTDQLMAAQARQR